MKAGVGGEFWMKAGADDLALLDGDDVVAVGGENLDIGAVLNDDGGADEYSFEGFFETGERDLGFEAVDLSTECIASNGDIEEAEGELVTAFDGMGEHDHSHASAPDRHGLVGAIDDELIQAGVLHEESDGGGFSSGNDETVNLGQVFGSSDFDD